MSAWGNTAKRQIHQYLLAHPEATLDLEQVQSQFHIAPSTARNVVYELVKQGYLERANVVRLRRVAPVNLNEVKTS